MRVAPRLPELQVSFADLLDLGRAVPRHRGLAVRGLAALAVRRRTAVPRHLEPLDAGLVVVRAVALPHVLVEDAVGPVEPGGGQLAVLDVVGLEPVERVVPTVLDVLDPGEPRGVGERVDLAVLDEVVPEGVQDAARHHGQLAGGLLELDAEREEALELLAEEVDGQVAVVGRDPGRGRGRHGHLTVRVSGCALVRNTIYIP